MGHPPGSLANSHATAGAFGDFKLDNILVNQQGFLTLADPLGNGNFGLLGLLFPQRQGGTLGYMAREVHAGGPISIQADMYSFAATLYHLVTGRAPQQGQNLDLRPRGWLVPQSSESSSSLALKKTQMCAPP